MKLRSSLSVFTLRQFLYELYPFLSYEYWEIHSFPHFSPIFLHFPPTCFDILRWNRVHHIVLHSCISNYESSVWSSFIRKLEEWYMTGVLCTVCGALVRLLQLLIGFRWNLTISKSSMPSIKWVFFVSITNLRWPPWPLIGWNIFRLLLCNRWMDFDETWQEIQHQTCNYYQ